jgi:hypothetical protein
LEWLKKVRLAEINRDPSRRFITRHFLISVLREQIYLANQRLNSDFIILREAQIKICTRVEMAATLQPKVGMMEEGNLPI